MMKTFRYYLECPDWSVRHEGTFEDGDQALDLADTCECGGDPDDHKVKAKLR